MIIVWDSTYEAIPTAGLPRNYIDDVLREIRYAIRERMEVEHDWGPFGTNDDGSHSPGYVSVADAGSSAPSGARNGSLYLRNDGGDLRLFMYFDPAGGTSYSWNMITTKDHAQLTNRDLVSAHASYLPLSTGTITGDLNMGGYHLRTGAGSTVQGFGGALLYRHKGKYHPTFGAVTIPTMTFANINVGWGRSDYFSLPNNTVATLLGSSTDYFFPEVHVAATVNRDIAYCHSPYGWGLKNASGSAIWCRYGIVSL